LLKRLIFGTAFDIFSRKYIHMKNLYSLLAVFSLVFIACEGPQGLPGPPGPPGQDVGVFVAQSFEVTEDFLPPSYQFTVEVPLDIELFESDMVLVYHLVGIVDGFDVWRILPETVYIETGEEFQYNFEHNFDFVTIYIDAPSTFNFNSLLPSETIGQTFRVVVLPVDFAIDNNIDVANFDEVLPYIEQ